MMFHATTSSLSLMAKPLPTNRFNHRNIARRAVIIALKGGINVNYAPSPPPPRIYIANYIGIIILKPAKNTVSSPASNRNHLSMYRINSTRVTDSTHRFYYRNRYCIIDLGIRIHRGYAYTCTSS